MNEWRMEVGNGAGGRHQQVMREFWRFSVKLTRAEDTYESVTARFKGYLKENGCGIGDA